MRIMDIIRDYRRADAETLVTAYNQLNPAQPLTADAFRQHLEEAAGDDGRIWVTVLDGRPAAYALLAPIPGLMGMAHLEGLVVAEWQRKGIGGRLLQHVYDAASKLGFQQLSCPVDALDSSAAGFLQQQGFVLEHEEIIFRRSLLQELPEMPAVLSAEIVNLPRRKAIAQFCALYERAFYHLPWSQPYSEAEATWLLQAAEDILFLRIDKGLTGFAWLQFNNPQVGEPILQERVGVIEPFGILPEFQGRGYGRFLLAAALRELQRRGARQAQIGTWTNNEVALGLYKSLGFEYHHSVYYLARNVI